MISSSKYTFQNVGSSLSKCPIRNFLIFTSRIHILITCSRKLIQCEIFASSSYVKFSLHRNYVVIFFRWTSSYSLYRACIPWFSGSLSSDSQCKISKMTIRKLELRLPILSKSISDNAMEQRTGLENQKIWNDDVKDDPKIWSKDAGRRFEIWREDLKNS